MAEDVSARRSVPGLPKAPARVPVEAGNPFAEAAGEDYHAIRPRYPEEAVAAVLAPLDSGRNVQDVVELGAGTGLFTAQLVNAGAHVRAVEPAAGMAEVLSGSVAEAELVVADAETTGLAESSADVVVAAQAWHWFDTHAVSLEAARIARPDARLVALWNQMDTAVAWVHRLTRIMRSGDVHAANPRQRRFAEPWGREQFQVWHWTLRLTPAQLQQLMESRSVWIRSNVDVRARMAANLSWYLHEHLGHADDEVIEIPQITVLWSAGLAG
ncbi:MAG: class I SAM-dependent methyltransferase [Micrococcus sp.]|nr:class I SAM-dependent methyltransferase [Micrococcus sp.]